MNSQLYHTANALIQWRGGLYGDGQVVITNCGRLCLYRKKINLSTCLAGQAVGIKEVDEGTGSSVSWITIWDISIWRKKLCSPSTALWAKSVTYVLGTFCNPCVRAGQRKVWLLK